MDKPLSKISFLSMVLSIFETFDTPSWQTSQLVRVWRYRASSLSIRWELQSPIKHLQLFDIKHHFYNIKNYAVYQHFLATELSWNVIKTEMLYIIGLQIWRCDIVLKSHFPNKWGYSQYFSCEWFWHYAGGELQ